MRIDQLKEKCTGCYACVNVCPRQCIDMMEDEDGFWYPVIDSTLCIHCQLCEKQCPVMVIQEEKKSCKPKVYAAINKDEEIRLQSSSGGVFTLLAENTLNTGGIVFGAAMTEDYRAVEHIAVECVEDLARLRGSKYVQSRIGNMYQLAKNYLQDGRAVLFSGTPCQIEGLRSYLQSDYEHLLCVDIICHGVPSPKVWERYVSFREMLSGAPTQQMNFRQKKDGWKAYAVHFEYSNGIVYNQKNSNDLFMQAFLRDVCLRPSCSQCRFKKLNRVSDITLADFWGIEAVLPDMDDDKGTSLVLLHSQKGRQVFEYIQKDLYIEEVSVEDAIRYNPSAVSSVMPHKNRREFLSHLESMPFDRLVNRYAGQKEVLLAKGYVVKVLRKMGLWNFVQRIRGRI